MAQDKANKCNTYDETILTRELECCYNEFRFYKNKNNEIAALGWAVSYNLQVLWQNNPRIDKINKKQTKQMNKQERERFEEIQKFLKSHNIEPLTLRYTPYPRPKGPIQFYTTLDWDKFYTKFPLMQQLSGEYLRDKKYIKKDIYSKNFREQVNKTFLAIPRQ